MRILANLIPKYNLSPFIGVLKRQTARLPIPVYLSFFCMTLAASSADVLINMSVAPNPVIQGANVTYSITVSNNGPDGATNVSMTDTLPAG